MGASFLSFDRFRLDVRERMLTKDGAPVSVGSRAFDLLLALAERAGETVSRDELLKLVWPDVIVAKVNLRVHIAGLRKALGQGRDGSRFIVSVAGQGYRFVAPVSRAQTAVKSARGVKSSAVPLHERLERMLERDTAIATLSTQLSRRRFITLGGPGGWGRTGVTFAIAHALVTDFDNAVCFVDFAGVEDPARVAIVVAAALGCEIQVKQPLTTLLGYLRDKEMLLVFDNCDSVFGSVAQLTERVLDEAPLVHVLIGSLAVPRV